MQPARGAPIASTSSEISGVIPLTEGRKAKEAGGEKGGKRERERATLLIASRDAGRQRETRKSRRIPGLQETTPAKETHNYHSYAQLWRAPNC